MKTIALAFLGLMLFAQEPVGPLTTQNSLPASYVTPPKPPTLEDLQSQVTQLQQQVAQKDQQIAAMSAQLTASGKMFGACFQSLAEAEQRAAQKR